MIPYGRQDIQDDDIEQVIAVLKSDFITQGPMIPKFEKAVANYCSAEFALAINSATSALHIACLSLGLGDGDLLWTVPNTFVASANCALYCGARVDFVDIDPQTYNISIAALEEKLQLSKQQDCLPKVLVVVHFSGQSCDMLSIHRLAKQYGFSVIEDASHAIGGYYLDNLIGGCQYSDITVFSFHPVKIITSGEGGMVMTNCPDLHGKMQLLRSHGITRDEQLLTENQGGWYYEQQILGFNYRMTDIQAALGLSQLARIDEYIEQRHKKAQVYSQAFSNLPIITPYQAPDTYSSYHLYVIRLEQQFTDKKRKIFDFLRINGVGVNCHYIPVHLQPYYRQLGFRCGDFPQAENYYKQAITIPLYPTMTRSQQMTVIDVVQQSLNCC